jgi:3'-phosphoadenosine 5'-phosphosulfate sulfotransferase (PAPS reductase)/FAD synthetase/predicted nucleic acid-binding protein
MFEAISVKIEVAVRIMVGLIERGYALCGTASGGKDSGCASILMLEAVRRVTATGREQPDHFITSANTTIENPSLLSHLDLMLVEIADWTSEQGLPVTVHVATPSLAAQFVVSTIGRGTLVRTPENGVRDGKRIRACADSWKVKPQLRLLSSIKRDARRRREQEVVTVLGNRFAESRARGTAMLARGESAVEPVRSASGEWTLSPLFDWTTDDVWTMLAMFANEQTRPFPTALSPRSIERMADLYRAANEGTCGVVLGESGTRSACGSRFGCAFCCMSGDRDRSMESMIQEPAHAHLAGLNAFRNYLLATQWDLRRRELVGRTVSKAGYVRVQPDVLSYAERIRLLQYLLTLDALEIERAERMEADLVSGRVPDTPANRELCGIQFELVTPAQLVAIDFMLSMHHYAPHAFPALKVWYDVHRLGRRYAIPKVDEFPKVPIPHHGWFYIGEFNADAPVDGLRDYSAEQWNRYLHPDRAGAYAHTTAGERVVWFEESNQLEVDAEAACLFVTCTYDAHWVQQAQQHAAIDSARFWLNERILRLPRGMSQRYQEMAKRGQYFARLAERHNLTPAELDAHLIKHGISNAEHQRLLEISTQPAPSPQLELFSLAA